MVTINYAFREVVSKIVYYGPGLSGKTTNLQYVYSKVPSKTRGEMISLATEADRTLYFDFLPINLGTIQGFATKFQLYTVPGQVFYNATRKLVLRGVDGMVFVADSQLAKMDENIESLNNLKENLQEYGRNFDDIPLVIQYNKRDLEGIASIEQLQAALNPRNVPYFEAAASKGTGVFDTLKAICKIVLDKAKKETEPQAVGAPQVHAAGGEVGTARPETKPAESEPVAEPKESYSEPAIEPMHGENLNNKPGSGRSDAGPVGRTTDKEESTAFDPEVTIMSDADREQKDSNGSRSIHQVRMGMDDFQTDGIKSEGSKKPEVPKNDMENGKDIESSQSAERTRSGPKPFIPGFDLDSLENSINPETDQGNEVNTAFEESIPLTPEPASPADESNDAPSAAGDTEATVSGPEVVTEREDSDNPQDKADTPVQKGEEETPKNREAKARNEVPAGVDKGTETGSSAEIQEGRGETASDGRMPKMEAMKKQKKKKSSLFGWIKNLGR
jgi:signal recognition particle receptor subunit beta